MERYAWKALVAEGREDEYVRRHDEIWPEMRAELRRAGIRNYSIWLSGRELFGYYECGRGLEYARTVYAESEVVRRWGEFMSDILIFETDPATGRRKTLHEVFYLE